MGFKLSSFVIILMVVFIAKVSYESAIADNSHDKKEINDRSPASIDQSYQDHLNKR